MAERSKSIGIRFPTSLMVRAKPDFGGEPFDAVHRSQQHYQATVSCSRRTGTRGRNFVGGR